MTGALLRPTGFDSGSVKLAVNILDMKNAQANSYAMGSSRRLGNEIELDYLSL